jgi:2-dehydropantoate 2-reductase
MIVPEIVPMSFDAISSRMAKRLASDRPATAFRGADAIAATAFMNPPIRQQRSLTIAVVGIGGIGAVAAGCLQEAGRHRVIACARKPLDRLVIERPEGVAEIQLHTLTNPAEAEDVDWVLLCTKAHQIRSTAPWLARLCNSSTRVAVLQNGIDHAARTSPFVGQATVVPTVVYFNSERLGAARVRFRHTTDHGLAVRDDTEDA